MVTKGVHRNEAEIVGMDITSTVHKLMKTEFYNPNGIPTIFLDPFYNSSSQYSTDLFQSNSQKLLDFTLKKEKFEFKDIEVVLTEKRQLKSRCKKQKKKHKKLILILNGQIEEVNEQQEEEREHMLRN